MELFELDQQYDLLQQEYGAKGLKSIHYGGCLNNPELCFVFMNPTGKNIASAPEWQGLRAPWIGTKSIWDLFYPLGLIDDDLYWEIKRKKPIEWTPEFAEAIYSNLRNHKVFITNFVKCTQVDARHLPNHIYFKYLPLLEEEVSIVDPKCIFLFGNNVSSVFLGKRIMVSSCRKKRFEKTIQKKSYACYPVFYPVGNGRRNIDKSIEDIRWVIQNNLGQ